MSVKAFVVSAACCLAAAACNDTPVGITSGPAFVRVVNSTFQLTAAGTPDLAEPRAIDFLVDSSTTGAGAANIAPASVSPAPTGNPQDGYRELSQGIHTFLARLSAPATPNTSLFTAGSDPTLEFIPKLFFTGDTYYTIIVAGIAPQEAKPEAGSFIDPDLFSHPFPILDDNAPPPIRDGKRMARLRLVNAAPYSITGGTSGGTISFLLTEGDTPPTPAEVAALRVSGSATYRGQSTYTNAAEGTYYVTLVSGSPRTVIAQQQVALASGQVLTFLVQNSGPVDPATPAAGYVMTKLVDATF
jgi:hypothetical protein